MENYSKIDHTLIDRWHSGLLDIQSFRGTDSDTAHLLTLRERLEVSNEQCKTLICRECHLSDIEGKGQYEVKISNGGEGEAAEFEKILG
jgi:hypothetical protein